MKNVELEKSAQSIGTSGLVPPNRRTFLDYLLGTSALVTLGFGSKPGILVLTDSGELKACSATCTHLDCIVQYRPDLKHIWCACHNGHYTVEGKNISAPHRDLLKNTRSTSAGMRSLSAERKELRLSE